MNTTLHIAPEHTTLTLPDGSRHTLAIGSATLLRQVAAVMASITSGWVEYTPTVSAPCWLTLSRSSR